MELDADTLLSAYAHGFFPMGEGRESGEIRWYAPELRGILPLEAFHLPKSLAKRVARAPYDVTFDTDFDAVIRACADTRRPGREETWINDTLIALYGELAARGHAHSVECRKEGVLVGGLYGVSLGGAFFGESMFSTAPDASKIALVHLVRRLIACGYTLLDTQYVNEHLLQFGVVEIAQADYRTLLAKALNASPNPSTRFRTASDIKS